MVVQIAALRPLTVDELLERYVEVYGHESRSRNRQWLFKRIAYRLQELRYGGLTPRAIRKQQELATGGRLRRLPPPDFDPGPASNQPLVVAPKAPVAAPHTMVAVPKASVNKSDPRLPPVGTVLERCHRGQTHRVTVLENGFLYDEVTYGSLSAVAKVITGSHRNGIAWFGLSQPKSSDGKAVNK